MKSTVLFWAPLSRWGRKWGLYFATPDRIRKEAGRLKDACEMCGQSDCREIAAFTNLIRRRVFVDVTMPIEEIPEQTVHELLHVSRGRDVPEAPHDETFVHGAAKSVLHVFGQFGFQLPPFPERFDEFRTAALAAKKRSRGTK